MGARGAAINTAAWIHLQEQNISVFTFSRGNDTSLSLPTFYGLFFADGRPKPVAQAFALWWKMSAYPRRRQTTLSAGSRLHVLCGGYAAGELALLIANPSSAAVSWRVENSAPGTDVTTLQEINPADGSVRRSTLSILAAEIPGYSVQPVEVKASGPPASRAF